MMLPYPPTFGKRMEIWTCLRALAAEGHEVTLVSFNDSGQRDIDERAISTVCRDMNLVPLKLSGRSALGDYGSRLCSLTTPNPYDAWRFHSKSFRERVERRLATEHFDAIICGEVFMMENIPRGCHVPIVLKKDHIATTILERYVAHEHNPVKKAYGFIEYAKTRRWETAVCRRANAIMACSELEREAIQKMCPGIPVTVAPNVVDTGAYDVDGEEGYRTVLYHGMMDWYPNQDAVEFFISEILPPLRRMIPDVRFVVAGRSSSDRFRKRFANVAGVEFTGTVPDMRPIIKRCAVCVVPLRIASGTRFKILEAAAMGKPVVSTWIGAEGLDLADGSEILLADEPGMFAQRVADLLKDTDSRRRLGIAARHRVERSFNLAILRQALRDTLALVSPTSCRVHMQSRETMEIGESKYRQ